MSALRGASLPEISIIIPTLHRVDQLRRCLESLTTQRNAPSWQLVISAPPDAAVQAMIREIVPSATIVEVGKGAPALRRNAVLSHARGDLLLFLDDDVIVPDHYLHSLDEQQRQYPDIDVFGGPNLTPPGSSYFQVVQGAVLSSVVGSGPVRRRYGARAATEADERWFTLCNLAIRRQVMTEFDGDLAGGEENELLSRLSDGGARMRYDPDLWCAHERRADLRGFATQMVKYGRGRGQLGRRAPRTLRPAYLAPSLLLVAIVALAAVAASTGEPLLLLSLAWYPVLVALQAGKVALTMRRPRAVGLAALLLPLMHGCYGVGVIRGLLEPGGGVQRHGSIAHQWNTLLILVRRQLRLLRKRSVLGLLWPMLTPWVMLILYSFVFHSVLSVPIPRYGIFLFAGLLPWSFLSQTMGSSVTSLSLETDLIRRGRFAYSLLPLAVEIAASVYFLLTLAGFVGYLGVRGELRWAVLPAILLPVVALYFFAGAMACVLAVIDIYNRDLRQMLNNILTVWFFLVPIVYQQEMLTHRLLFMRSIDPVNLIVGEFRDVLYAGRLQRPLHYVIVLFVTSGLLLLATGLVRRLSPSLPKDV